MLELVEELYAPVLPLLLGCLPQQLPGPHGIRLVSYVFIYTPSDSSFIHIQLSGNGTIGPARVVVDDRLHCGNEGPSLKVVSLTVLVASLDFVFLFTTISGSPELSNSFLIS